MDEKKSTVIIFSTTRIKMATQNRWLKVILVLTVIKVSKLGPEGVGWDIPPKVGKHVIV